MLSTINKRPWKRRTEQQVDGGQPESRPYANAYANANANAKWRPGWISIGHLNQIPVDFDSHVSVYG